MSEFSRVPARSFEIRVANKQVELTVPLRSPEAETMVDALAVAAQADQTRLDYPTVGLTPKEITLLRARQVVNTDLRALLRGHTPFGDPQTTRTTTGAGPASSRAYPPTTPTAVCCTS